jgi:hypothetical protein
MILSFCFSYIHWVTYFSDKIFKTSKVLETNTFRENYGLKHENIVLILDVKIVMQRTLQLKTKQSYLRGL